MERFNNLWTIEYLNEEREWVVIYEKEDPQERVCAYFSRDMARRQLINYKARNPETKKWKIVKVKYPDSWIEMED